MAEDSLLEMVTQPLRIFARIAEHQRLAPPIPMSLRPQARTGHRDDMAGFDAFDALKKTVRTVFRQECENLRGALLVRSARDLGQCVQPFGHRGEGEKPL